jgi:hypothetical protein
MAASFIGGGNPGKTTDLPEVTEKMYPIKLYRIHLAISGIRTHNFNRKKEYELTVMVNHFLVSLSLFANIDRFNKPYNFMLTITKQIISLQFYKWFIKYIFASILKVSTLHG